MVHVAVVGAGPIGLDSALAAHQRGWTVTVYEKAPQVAGHIRDWSHVQMFTPWSMNASARMTAALPRPENTCPHGSEFAQYLERISVLLPSGSVRTAVSVEAIARDGLLKSDEIGTAVRADLPFRLLVRDSDGAESIEQADLVIDSSGTWSNPSPLGRGGIPAVGERSVEITRRIPEIDQSWSGRRVLLVGSGNSAQTAARGLAAAGAELTWAVRRSAPTWGAVENDVLPDRAALVTSSRTLDQAGTVIKGVTIDALRETKDGVDVTLIDLGGVRQHVHVDAVVSLVGSVPDASIYRQLQVHECYATEGVMNLAATLLGSAGGDCLTQVGAGVDSLRNPEPRFFVLGSKSYGRNNTFLLRIGYEQVDAVFDALDSELPRRG